MSRRGKRIEVAGAEELELAENADLGTLLVVGDDRRRRKAIVCWLSRDGYEIVQGSLSMEMLRYVRPRGDSRPRSVEAVIMDVTAARESGLSLAEFIRCADWAIPIILIAEDSGGEAGRLTLEADASRLAVSAVICGTTGPDRLRATVRAHLIQRAVVN